MRKDFFYFLKERIGWILLYYLNTGLITLTFALVLSFEQTKWEVIFQQIDDILLLSSGILTLFLIIQYIRWLPTYRRLKATVEQATTLDELSWWSKLDQLELDQTLINQAMHHFYRVAVQEREQYQKAHQQHLEFIHLWVHEMKTPVATLSLLMQQANDRSTDIKNLANEANEEVEKLDHGLNMILSMARLSDFSSDFHIKPVSLLDQVRELINLKKKSFIRYGIFPKLEAIGEEWDVLTDPKWNRFVIEQIIHNALKYASQIHQRSFLYFQLTKEKRWIQLSIRDEGPGIPKHDLKRIFDPFFTGDNGRAYAQATGMGLYLVKKVCIELNHEIEVKSEVGKGTIVQLRYGI